MMNAAYARRPELFRVGAVVRVAECKIAHRPGLHGIIVQVREDLRPCGVTAWYTLRRGPQEASIEWSEQHGALREVLP